MTLSVDHTNILEHDYYDEHGTYSVHLKQEAHQHCSDFQNSIQDAAIIHQKIKDILDNRLQSRCVA